jgi:probable HAF family extracellular repeat protein
MKSYFKSLSLILSTAGLFALSLNARAQDFSNNYKITVSNGAYPVVGVTGTVVQNFYTAGFVFTASTTYTTDANGVAQVNMQGYLGEGLITSVTATAPPGYTFVSPIITLFPPASASQFLQASFSVATGPLSGSVLSSGLPINSVSVTSSGGTTTIPDGAGSYSLGTGAVQTVSASKSGVIFSAPQLIYPGHPLAITVVSGVISGQISAAQGVNVAGVNVAFITNGVTACSALTDTNGNYTSCVLSAAIYQVVPSKTGFHFSGGGSVTAPVGLSGVKFAMASTPPRLGSAANVTQNENVPAITNVVPVAYGDVPSNSVALTLTSSNPALIPNTAPSLFVAGTPGPGPAVVMIPVPGAVGSSTITFSLNDGVNPPVTTNFNVTVNSQPQMPVAGMPVALNFNGTNNLARIPGLGTNAPATEITIEFWENPQQIAQQSTFIMDPDVGSNRINAHVPWVGGNYGTIYWDFGNIGDGTGRIAYALPSDITGRWSHFAFVSSKTGNNGAGFMQIYINGVQVASKQGGGTFTPQAYDMVLGHINGGNPFAGSLSEFRIWNVARTPTQILQNMDNPLVGNEPGLIAYYRFNEKSGVTIHDSAKQNTGVVLGDAPYPTWSSAPTNFPYYMFPAFSSSNVMYLPGYVQDQPLSSLAWSITANNNLHGTLKQVAGGQWQYTPDPTFTGGDASFTYAVSTGPNTLSNAANVFIHVAPLSPPILTPIGNQLTEEDSPTAPIIFSVTDTNIPISQLMLSMVCDNPSLVDPNNGFTLTTLSNSGTTHSTMSLVITPNPGAIGSGNVTLSANDGHNLVSETFVLQVNQKPAYTIVDLGVLSSRFASYGTAINNLGQVVGYATDGTAAQNQKQAFLYTGFDSGQQVIALNTNFSLFSAAYGINNASQIIGTAQSSDGTSHVFVYDLYRAPVLQNFGALGSNSQGSTAVGLGINDSGAFVGDGTTATVGQLHAFKSGATLLDLGLAGNNVANGINNAGQIVGYSVVNGLTNAFVITPTATNNTPVGTNFLGSLPSGTNSMAFAINQFGDVVGAGGTSSSFTHAWLLPNGTTTLVDLGTLPGTFSSVAYGLNGFKQVVGSVTGTGGLTHAFLYTTGKMNDLNNLLPFEETNAWTLTEARGINDQGQIVGTGRINGKDHAFLALPARVVGKPLPRPLGTVAVQPAIDVIDPQQPDDSAANSFFWSVPQKQLYAVRPVTARIHWPTAISTSGNPTNLAASVDITSKSVWPRDAQTHIANVPVQAEPKGAPLGSFSYSFSSILYSTNTAASVDPGTKVFSAQTPGYTVLRYLSVTPGVPTDPVNSPSYFQVVRTVIWNDSNYLTDNVPATIGTTITNSTHFDYAGRNGWIYFPKSVYDGVPTDANRAYDRPTRTGPIIPVNVVNKNLVVPDDDLVVVWYHTNQIGVSWADAPTRYIPQWPATNDPTNTIVIASQQGSGINGFPGSYLRPQVYTQNDPTLPGFNPNEEHALISSGVMYALRNDLNSQFGNLSQPFALLKYQDATASNQWTMRAFKVVATNDTFQFVYTGTAGTEIQPPLPLSGLELCNANNVGVSGPFYKASVNGHLYARAAGLMGQTTNVVLRYWYPMQDGFYDPGVPPGSCLPWLDQGTGVPVNVTYNISWPNLYHMQVGQTLTTPVNGLPDITHLLNARIIYDDLNPAGGLTTTNLARLYDPFSARSLPVPPTAPWLSSFKMVNVNGQEQFGDLPYFLRIRLIYDPVNSTLSFIGLMAHTTPGADPVLLPNVMSLREREAIKQLDGGTDSTDFDHLIDTLYKLTRNPNRLTVKPPGVSTNNFDDALLVGLTAMTNSDQSISLVPDTFGNQPKALTTGLFGAPSAQANPPGSTNFPPRYITVVQDDPTTPGSSVQMYVIQVDGGPYLGYLAVMPGDNAFDQRLTFRYTDDFGGDPGQLQFQWYYFPGANGGVSPPLPTINPDGSIKNANGWLVYTVPDVVTQTNGLGANYVTLGLGGESGLLTMSDNWFVSRYIGYGIDGQTNWSGWVGEPGGGAGQFAQGWINRVLTGLNPFEARSTDFHTSPINTYNTILEQAGPRYEGPIALNPDPNYLNTVGLIQAYQTVLRVGETLSIDGTPPVNYQPANQALLNAASRISDFYVVLGNEAYAEASDPTIGFKTSSAKFGSLASSIFAFEDQVDTVLDQELQLLRGRDDKTTTVRAAPVYNRLYWNFTGGNGEVAYVQTFNITDVNGDGLIDASDAKTLFPQGHGDAWGHYLTSLTVYYDLLRNTNYNWVPRPEAVTLGGVAVQVNFKDERKFAHAAAAKAQTGADILDLTYRSAYVDDPNGQYQGYKDTDPVRAWGLSEWARRAGQGAYFDWVTVNAVLPAVDPNTNDTGLAKVDRTTVTDIGTIPTAYAAVQAQLDKADAGLNPVGLAKAAVPFDIDPTQVSAGKTHFEQIYDRAVAAMVNAATVWDQANEFTSALRQQQDTVNSFSQNITKQDQDYKDRLIEVFGYPFAGDIGTPGSAFPAGYDGPDIYHYMYIDTSTFDSQVAQPSSVLSAFFTALPGAGQYFPADLPSTYTQTTNVLMIGYPLADSLHRFQPPVTWGQRRAPGEIQMALSDVLQSQGRMDQAIAQYNALIQQIEDSATLLQDQFGLNTTNEMISDTAGNTVQSLQSQIDAAQTTVAQLNYAQQTISTVASTVISALPTVEGLADDCLAPVRGVVAGVAGATELALGFSVLGVNQGITGMQEAQTQTENDASGQIATNTQDYQMKQQLLALEELLRQEPQARLECFTLRETVAQNVGRFQAALAKGQQILEQRATFAKQAAAQTQSYRYDDMTFRIFRNDAIQKYKAQFDLAQRYVYLAAIAYDYETELLGGSSGAGQQFLTDIIRQQSLGEMSGGQPVNGVQGLADPLARLGQNFAVLKGQLGFNNPQTETGKFSLRYGLFRQQTGFTNAIPINGVSTNDWATELKNRVVPDLWQLPEFRRYCRPFAPESAGPQPGLVIRFGTTITSGLNFFGWPLSGGDSAYDSTLFATKVRSVGTWFAGYDNSGLSVTPRIYLFPVGADVLRSPTGSSLATREWRVVDQQLPVPFPLGTTTMSNPAYIPVNDSLSGTLEDIRRFSSFKGYVDQGNVVDVTQVTTDSRLIGRSVWNTEWMLIIPGATLLADPNQGLLAFINSVSDIKIYFQTYSYSGN